MSCNILIFQVCSILSHALHVSPNLNSDTGRVDISVKSPLSSFHTLSFESQLHGLDDNAQVLVTPHAHLTLPGEAPPQ